MEDGKIKEFNCYALLSIMLAQLGVNPDFASAVEAQGREIKQTFNCARLLRIVIHRASGLRGEG